MKAIASLLLAAVPLFADFDRSLWRWRKPVTAEVAGRVSAVRLDRDARAASRADLADVRLVRAGVEVPYVLECGPEREALAALAPERTEDAQKKISRLVLDLGSRLPFDCVRLVTSAASFYRTAEFDTSDDGKQWRTVAQRPVYRVAQDESLAVTFCLQHCRYLRIRIFNRDDRPVPVKQVIVEAPRASLKFLPEAAGPYWLYYGNPKATAPGYDLAVILAKRDAAPLILTAGPEQPNPDYRAPAAPWTERRPEVLYIALAAAVVGLGWVVVRFWLRAGVGRE